MPDEPRNPEEYDNGSGESSLGRVARLGWDMGQVNGRLDKIDKKLEIIEGNIPLLDQRYDARYAPLGEFRLVRLIVFGMVAMILVAFFTALIGLVIISRLSPVVTGGS